MARFAHFNPEDPAGAMERLIDRADHAKKEARENGPDMPAQRETTFSVRRDCVRPNGCSSPHRCKGVAHCYWFAAWQTRG